MKILLASILLFIFSSFSFCQTLEEPDQTMLPGDGEVKVISYGRADDRESALRNAFENAIIEAMGSFLSSTTIIENDALIKDEILLYSKGFIKKYKILTEDIKSPDYSISISAIVTRNQIYETIKAKGIMVDYDPTGMLFKVNEWKILHGKEMSMAKNVIGNELMKTHNNLYDFSIETSDPVISGSNYSIPVSINYKANSNLKKEIQNLKLILSELSFDKIELHAAFRTAYKNELVIFNTVSSGKKNKLSYVPHFVMYRSDEIDGFSLQDINRYDVQPFANNKISRQLSAKEFNNLKATNSVNPEISKSAYSVYDFFKSSDYSPFIICIVDSIIDNNFKRSIMVSEDQNIDSDYFSSTLYSVTFYKFLNKQTVAFFQMYIDWLNSLKSYSISLGGTNFTYTLKTNPVSLDIIGVWQKTREARSYFYNYLSENDREKVYTENPGLNNNEIVNILRSPHFDLVGYNFELLYPTPGDYFGFIYTPDYQNSRKEEKNILVSETLLKNVTNIKIQPESNFSGELIEYSKDNSKYGWPTNDFNLKLKGFRINPKSD